MQTDQLLALSRAAAGGDAWDALHALELEGTIRAGGLAGPYRQIVAADGRSVTSLTLGPAAIAKGFDGTAAWQRGPNGEVVVQDADAARRAAVTEAFVNARGWWFPARWPARFDTPEMHDAHAVLRVVPDGGQAVELWFDATTHRLARVVQNVAGTDFTRRYEDERVVAGLRLAHRIVTGSGDPRHETVVELAHVRPNPLLADDAFERPAQAFDDVSFVDGTAQASLAIDVVDRHVYVDVTIAGADLRLMLDTGGVNLLTPAAAARAGVQAVGALEGRGPGAGSVDAGFARIERLVIGERVVLERQLFRVMPLPGFDDVEGTTFDGLLGVELFQRLAVTIDYAGRRLTLARPGAFEAPAGGATLPLAFHAHFPVVQAALDGIAGEFWLDTGNRNALTLWTPFVRAHDLAARYGASAECVIGWGVGGRAAGRVARAGRLALGPVTIDAPLLTLPTADDGPTATRGVAGNIGGDLLRRFIVGFDYARRVVHLAPGVARDEPFGHDRAGLWINRQGDGDGDGVVVVAVMAGGPADVAGVAVGDVVVDVDAAATPSLDTLRERLRDRDRALVRLRLRRAGAVVDATLALRDLA